MIVSCLIPRPASADVLPLRTITIGASASVAYTPDVARMTLGVEIYSATASEAIAQLNRKANALIAALRGAGIREDSINTLNYDVALIPPEQASKNQPHAVYRASEDVAVATSVTNAGRTLDAALAAGANRSYGLQFETSKMEQLHDIALARAVTNARTQATAIATAAGVQLDAIQAITNYQNFESSAQPRAIGAMATADRTGAQIVAGKQTVDANIQVVFLIK
ncbi:MAG: SIMPL domain-containing protein [Candidatus Eremiobacteraeota bacterium]|nr:SIMPL domain-containing protein [Candidatus Eremiobacteraeota bacterium]